MAQLYANDTDDGRHGIVYYRLVEPPGGEKLPFYIQNTGEYLGTILVFLSL